MKFESINSFRKLPDACTWRDHFRNLQKHLEIHQNWLPLFPTGMLR